MLALIQKYNLHKNKWERGLIVNNRFKDSSVGHLDQALNTDMATIRKVQSYSARWQSLDKW